MLCVSRQVVARFVCLRTRNLPSVRKKKTAVGVDKHVTAASLFSIEEWKMDEIVVYCAYEHTGVKRRKRWGVPETFTTCLQANENLATLIN